MSPTPGDTKNLTTCTPTGHNNLGGKVFQTDMIQGVKRGASPFKKVYLSMCEVPRCLRLLYAPEKFFFQRFQYLRRDVISRHLLWVLRNIEALLHCEEDLLEALQPLRLHLLAPFKHVSHVLHVLRVVVIDVLYRE